MGTEIPPSDLGKVVDASVIAGFMPYLDPELVKMENALTTRVFRALDDGELTPDAAMYAWMEVRAYRKLKKRLDLQVRVGHTVGERISEHLDGGSDGEEKEG